MEILDQYTPRQLRNALFFALDVWIYLYRELTELDHPGRRTFLTDEGLDTVDISILGPEGQVVGLAACELGTKILICNDDEDNPAGGTYLMKYGVCEEVNGLLYWTTKMKVISYKDIKHDTTKTS